MAFYKCGHDRGPAFIKRSVVELAAFNVWKDRHGPDGDRDHCWECEKKRIREDRERRDREMPENDGSIMYEPEFQSPGEERVFKR